MNRSWMQAATVVAMVVVGCTKPAVGPAPPAAPTTTESGIRVRAAAELPKVGEYPPPIDDHRLEVAPPADWLVVPRTAGSLITFVQDRGSQLPRIAINAQDAPEGIDANLTEDNVAELLKWLETDLQESQRTAWEKGLPIILGETLFVRHVRPARDASGTPLVVQSLQTVQNGRLYTVELIVEVDAARAEEYEGSLTRLRDHGYAVAASMRFAAAGVRFDPLAGFNVPADDSPAPDAPAESSENADQ